MQTATAPPNETERLRVLASFAVLDTPPEDSLDTLTQLAARLLDMPIALVSLVDAHRQWFKSHYGISVSETARDISFCGHVVEDGEPLLVSNALEDSRFADNPLVLSGPQIRFYCGYPLITLDGVTLGTLCVIDRRPRTLEPEQREVLELLAKLVVRQLEYHRDRLTLRAQQSKLEAHAEHSAQVEVELRELTAAAQRASRAKTEFLANMSHEIRTPMNAILGMGELLLGTELSGKQRKYVQSVRSAGCHLLGLINDVLDVAKIEAGKVELDSVAFKPRALVDDIEDLMEARAAETGLVLDCHVAAWADETVIGDFGRLRQVLVNLVGNAFKYTNQGKIKLEITRLSLEKYRFDVTDTGVGIPLERQDAIFEGFTQADNSTTRRYGGTGLGLTISKALVEVMGGSMWLQSRPGFGSKFSFTANLPAQRSAAGALATLRSLAAGAPLPTWPPSAGGGAAGLIAQPGGGLGKLTGDELAQRDLRILVVDDVELNCDLVAAFLDRFPWQLEFAHNGQTAADMCASVDYDLVLVDVQMPIMDGYQAARRIRAHEQASSKRRTPIVALTAHVMEAEVKLCLAAGCDAHLGKPITRVGLVDSILDFARGSRPGRPGEAPLIVGASTAEPAAEIAHLVLPYLDACRARVVELKQALEGGDFEAIAKHAHNLRGTGGAFGFESISEHAGRMQQACEQRDSLAAEREIVSLQCYLET